LSSQNDKSDARHSAVRSVARGDVLETGTPRAAQIDETGRAVQAANEQISSTLQHVLSTSAAQDPATLMDAIKTLMSGLSPDETTALRSVMLEGDPALWHARASRHPDDELARNWREGGYPYRNLMSRHAYEKQKYALQVELLKLQAWVRETGQRLVILFEGRDAAGKGGAIKRFMEREIHPLKQWKLSPVDLASLDKWNEYTDAKEAMFAQTDTADSPWAVVRSDCKKRARLNAMRHILHKLAYANRDVRAIGMVDPLIVGRTL
jgi:hypothetical protein